MMKTDVNLTFCRLLVLSFAVYGLSFHCERAHAERWDGLSELQRVAKAASVDLATANRLDLATLTSRDALLIVAPGQSLPVPAMTAFLRAGGRVALLDDVGSGERLLAAYQVSRSPASAADVPALRGQAAWLIAYPASEHPLVEGVPLLLTNRAVVLHHPDLRPVLTFGHTGRALAVAGAVGLGRLVAVGDGSLLINQMLQIPAHRRFATNLLRYLARPGGRVWLVTSGTTLRGGGGAGGSTQLDEWLRRVSHPDLPSVAVAALSVGAMLLAMLLGLSGLPRRSPYVRPDLFPASAVPAGYAGRLASSLQAGTPLGWPLLDYKRELEAELSYRFHMPLPLDHSGAVARAQQCGLDDAEAKELAGLLSFLASLERTMHATALSTGRIEPEELGNVVRTAERLLARVGNGRG